MPQLTFDKEQCPASISIKMRWDQLTDTYSLLVLCCNAAEQIQASAALNLPERFFSWDVALMVAEAFENWLDCTPQYVVHEIKKRTLALRPDPVPAGLDPRINLGRHRVDGLGARPTVDDYFGRPMD